MLEDDPKAVESATPSNAAEEFLTKPAPLIITAVSLAPTITDGGTSPVMDGTGLLGRLTVIVADPDTFVYPLCAEFAMQVPVPTPDGVNTPEEVIVPPVAVQVTPELYAPVP